MDQHTTSVARHDPHLPPGDSALLRFAQSLRQHISASQVLLFGSRARGQARPDSDFDLIVVSPQFAGVEPARRALGLRELWYRAGGAGPVDLICVTPEEFAAALRRISLIAAVAPGAIDLLHLAS